MSEPLLLFEGVSKWYGTVLALNQVTLEMRGGITGLVGTNGAGKSTLMSIATGQIQPSLGRASVAGIEAWDWRARRRVGYCPDADAFYEDMNGRDFVRAMAQLNGLRGKAVRERTEACLNRVGMTDRASRKLRGYSKGMRQRIKLAQALLTEPQLLILDEPLSGIDPIGRRELINLFLLLASEGTGILISSHELEELGKLTNHVAVMARGRIAAVGTVEQIRDRLQDFPLSVRIRANDAKTLASTLFTWDGVQGAESDAENQIVIKTDRPQLFFEQLTRLAADGDRIHSIEPLDESAHAVLGYVLGGEGRT